MSTEPEELPELTAAAPDAGEPQALIETMEPAPEAVPEEVAAAAAAAAAAATEEPGPPKESFFKKLLAGIAKTGIYTWLLVLSLLAISVAVLLLALELRQYDWDIKAKRAPTVSAPPVTAPAK